MSQKILVLAPHPDDMAIGCGGTIKSFSSAGHVVDVVYMTKGERGLKPGAILSEDTMLDLARQRSREARQCCTILGVSTITFLNGNDGQLHQQSELIQDLLRILEGNDYHIVFCPWKEDGHPDHIATFTILARALMSFSKEVDVWFYEVWNPLWPNKIVPIDATIDYKLAAIKAHASQMECKDYVNGFFGLSRYRSLFHSQQAPSKYAEAFLVYDKASLMNRLETEKNGNHHA